MYFLTLRGEQQGGGHPSDLILLRQVQIAAALQTDGDKALVQGLNHGGVLVGLPDQPATVGSAIHKKFQGQRPVGFLRLVQRLLPVRAPLYQL
jgi:hypothetical protein